MAIHNEFGRQSLSSQKGGPRSTNTDDDPADYALGIAAAKLGNHRKAAEAFQRAVLSNPDHASSHANLGAALASLKSYPAATRALENAVRLVPEDVKSLANLAYCLYLTGHFESAAQRAEQALVRNPANVSALRTITLSCLAINDGAKALKGAGSLFRVSPSRDSHELLVRSLLAAGLLADAEAEAERFVSKLRDSVSPSDHSHRDANRAIALAELLRAKVIRARVHTLKPTGARLPLVRQRRAELLELLLSIVAHAATGEAYFELGRAHHDLHQHEAAEQALRKSVELEPNHVAALELLGDVLVERSLNDEAVELLDRALSINPHQSKALLMRVRTIVDDTERDGFHAKLDEYLALPDARPVDQINWHFAKGQLFDKAKEYERAFAHYLKAGRLKEERQRGPEAPAAAPVAEIAAPQSQHMMAADPHRRHYDGSRSVFSREFFESRAEAGNPSTRPIFVVGVPRSGTTLMEQILASHPDVVGAGELPEISSFAARCDQLTEALGGYPQSLASVPVETLVSFGEEYLAQLERVSGTAKRVVDKMPGNLIHVGLIHTLFPNASIVRIRREPRDVCVSALKNHLDFPLCNLEKTARFCLACDRLAELWNDVLPGRVLRINYEELVTDLEANVRRLLQHCNLNWDDSCLEFYRTDRNVRTPSRWQVRKPAYNSSIGAWKRYAGCLTHLDEILGPPNG